VACYDVLILGAGPAGAATALALIRTGLSVAILCKPDAPGPLIGETVPPGIVQPLVRLGVWQDFLDCGHGEAPGTVVIWGNERPYESDFIFNPYGRGWHLNRSRFDSMLLQSARTAGTDVYDVHARECISEPGSRWKVLLAEGSSRDHVKAHWLVDATGRKSWLVRRLGCKRDQFDRLVALVRFAEGASTSDQRTLIETCPQGWWYAATLPQQQTVVAFFTDADLLPRSAAERMHYWEHLFAQTHLVSTLIPALPAASPIHTAAAASARSAPCAGRHWLAVGDAAQAYDPLSGQGILKALRSALHSAAIITADFEQREAQLDDLLARADRDFHAYRKSHREHYAREQRWPDQLFWKRRNGEEGLRKQ
jgi:flavin-dependent dehydrogenase